MRQKTYRETRNFYSVISQKNTLSKTDAPALAEAAEDACDAADSAPCRLHEHPARGSATKSSAMKSPTILQAVLRTADPFPAG